MLRSLAAGLCASLLACATPLPPFDDGGRFDGGPIDVDGSPGDAGPMDAGPTDAGPTDAGPTDAGELACPTGFAECDGDPAVACEADLSSRETCGSCELACPAHRTCVEGSCAAPAIVSLTAGAEHTCALVESGAVYCWGVDNRGQLGDGFIDGTYAQNRADAQPVVGVTRARAIRAGDHATCAIDADGAAVCWGSNIAARFGEGSLSVPIPEPLLFPGVLDPILDLSHNASHLCARTATAVACSGRNSLHQLGRESPDTHLLGAVVGLPAGRAARSVATGYSSSQGFTLVALDDGTVWCWGANDDGECARAPSSQVSAPAQIAELSNIVQVVAGHNFACALDMDGAVRCWGSNQYGEAGQGAEGADVLTPTVVAGSMPAVGRLAATGGSVLAVTLDEHAVWGWGRNTSNLLGRGPLGASPQPTPTPLLVDSGSTFDVALGTEHACLLRHRAGTSDEILCAGSNQRLQLGIDPSPDRDELTVVPGFP